jgi:hypothetical protein
MRYFFMSAPPLSTFLSNCCAAFAGLIKVSSLVDRSMQFLIAASLFWRDAYA